VSSAVLAKVGEEVAALQASAAAAAAAAAEAGGEEGSAGPGVSELLKPAKESAAVLKEVWNPMVSKACAQGKRLVCHFRVRAVGLLSALQYIAVAIAVTSQASGTDSASLVTFIIHVLLFRRPHRAAWLPAAPARARAEPVLRAGLPAGLRAGAAAERVRRP
jgi:hypothetical protein